MFKQVLTLLEIISEKYKNFLCGLYIDFDENITLKIRLQYFFPIYIERDYHYINIKTGFINDNYYTLSITDDNDMFDKYDEYWKSYESLESDLCNNIEKRLRYIQQLRNKRYV